MKRNLSLDDIKAWLVHVAQCVIVAGSDALYNSLTSVQGGASIDPALLKAFVVYLLLDLLRRYASVTSTSLLSETK